MRLTMVWARVSERHNADCPQLFNARASAWGMSNLTHSTIFWPHTIDTAQCRAVLPLVSTREQSAPRANKNSTHSTFESVAARINRAANALGLKKFWS